MEELKKILKKNIGIIVIAVFILIGAFLFLEKQDEQDVQNIFQEEENSVCVNIVENEIIEETKEIAIHITGEVKKTGVIYLKEGARVVDAIEQAGGTTKEADISKINLAYALQDGQKLYIPNKKDNKVANHILEYNEQDGYIDTNSKKNKKININTASREELQSLSGIGASIADKIINYRSENGKFKKIEDIKNVNGIGESKYKNIKDSICI